MPDIVESVATQVTKKIGDTDRVLKCINSYDLAELLREYRKQRKRQLIENLETVGADSEQKMSDLEEFDANPPSDWVAYLNTLEGQLHVIRLSLAKTYGAEAASIIKELDWNAGEMTDTIIVVCGMRRVEKEQATESSATYGDGGDEFPNVRTPAA